MKADPFQDAMVSAFRAFCERHKKTGRCWKHRAPIRHCGCDPGVYLDVDLAQARDLKRMKASSRLMRMKREKAFWEHYMAASASFASSE